jgi:hypothetical protein
MNVRILRRLFLPVGIAALVGASLYAMTGSSSAASTPQSHKAGAVEIRASAVETIRVTAGVGKVDGGKTVEVKGAVARIRQVGAEETGATSVSTSGPNEVCLAYYPYSASVGSGGYAYVTFSFSFTPFALGYMFEETNQVFYAEESNYWSPSALSQTVTILNNGPSTETIAGYYGFQYSAISGGC